jgi:chloramphenicol O-acetyltransferase type A
VSLHEIRFQEVGDGRVSKSRLDPADGISESERVKKSNELFSGHSENDVIYYTVLRGVTFISDSQPYQTGSSVPILVFGEMFLENSIYKIPHSIHVNHALVDGQHVSQYIQLFQQFLND